MAYPAAENDAKTEANLSEDENMPQSGLADELPVAAQPPISVDLSQQPGSSTNVESPCTFFDTVVNEFPSNITEPTEMLRYLQKKIVRGRPLEVTDPSTDLQRETNFITVDREKLKSVDDPRVTSRSSFMRNKLLTVVVHIESGCDFAINKSRSSILIMVSKSICRKITSMLDK